MTENKFTYTKYFPDMEEENEQEIVAHRRGAQCVFCYLSCLPGIPDPYEPGDRGGKQAVNGDAQRGGRADYFVICHQFIMLCAGDAGTKLGRLVLLFVFLLYGSRAVEEIIISTRFSPVIFVVCALLAGLYLVLYFRTRKPA